MKLSVIIVSYNVRYYLEQCLISVFRATKDIETEVFVVDNNSEDNTVEFLHERFGNRIHVIESNHNLGFARANNKAIRQSTGEYVLLLNPDTFVGENAIKTVLDFMDTHPKAGGAGVKMYNGDGTIAPESRRGLPTPLVSLMKMCGFSRRYYMSDLSWDEPGQIEVISGAFFMTRKSVLEEVGLLDKDFFMYGEDIDLSYRILQAGYENWYVPANILHYKGESTQKSSYRYVHVFYQAMIIFFSKHYGHLSFMLTIPIRIAIYLRAIIALIQMLNMRWVDTMGLRYKKDFFPMFCFLGSQRMINECRPLSLRKGLDASFCRDLEDVGECDVLVYDTEDAFSFEDVLQMASSRGGKNTIGTYNRHTKVLITPYEIVK
jgi:GT2 family glycosyltransferase